MAVNQPSMRGRKLCPDGCLPALENSPMNPSLIAACAAILITAAYSPAIASTASASPVSATSAPSAAASFTATRIAVGAGYSWGRGVLTFRGRDHSFTVRGLSALGLGASKMTGSAEIYHLNALEDFEGVYGAAGAGASAGSAGAGVAVLRNGKGVEIHLNAKEEGLELSLAISGVSVAFEPL